MNNDSGLGGGGLCRTDGRCQYAIDHGAEGMGHCPAGKCAMPAADEEEIDQYGNPTSGDSLPYCCFPDCGCDGARLCMAESGPNAASCAINIERGSLS